MKKFLTLILTLLFINSLSIKVLSIPLNKENVHGMNISDPNFNEPIIDSNSEQPPVPMNDFKTFKDTYLKIIENLSFRNTLWEQSTNFIKFTNRDELVNLWADGIKNKNGTLLYLISNENIKSQLKNLFKNNTSWFLDNTQNNIKSFSVSKGKKISKNLYYYDIFYKSNHVDGYPQVLKQHIAVEVDGKHFKICEFSNLVPQN